MHLLLVSSKQNLSSLTESKNKGCWRIKYFDLTLTHLEKMTISPACRYVCDPVVAARQER